MIFWLLLKLEISYRVMISWRILVSLRGFFWFFWVLACNLPEGHMLADFSKHNQFLCRNWWCGITPLAERSHVTTHIWVGQKNVLLSSPPIYLSTYLLFHLPAYQHFSRYLPTPSYMATLTYMVAIPIDLY
jgi:hypothetical protein